MKQSSMLFLAFIKEVTFVKGDEIFKQGDEGHAVIIDHFNDCNMRLLFSDEIYVKSVEDLMKIT